MLPRPCSWRFCCPAQCTKAAGLSPAACSYTLLPETFSGVSSRCSLSGRLKGQGVSEPREQPSASDGCSCVSPLTWVPIVVTADNTSFTGCLSHVCISSFIQINYLHQKSFFFQSVCLGGAVVPSEFLLSHSEDYKPPGRGKIFSSSMLCGMAASDSFLL